MKLKKYFRLINPSLPLAGSICSPLLMLGSLSTYSILASASVMDTNHISEIEEIVVSARRRNESIMAVPIAVTAYSGDALRMSGRENIVRLAESSPNTTLKVSRGTNTTITAFIRGVGQQDPLAGFESGVGIYIDDVYLNRPQGAVLDVYNVERVEILRGPQGTLYGKNTIGGAVKYVTATLSDTSELSIRTSLGSYDQRDLIVSGSLPITQNFRVGGALASFNRSGFGKNLYTGEEHYNKDILAGRLTVEWQPEEDWFVRFSGDMTEDDSNPKSGHRLIDATLTDNPVLDNVYDTRAGAAVNSVIKRNQVRQQGAAINVEHDLSATLVLKSITAYRRDDTKTPIDFDSLPDSTFDVPAVYENRQFSQEIQLLFDRNRWQGVAGIYYMDANGFNAFDIVASNLGLSIFTLGDVDSQTLAAFSEVTFDVSDTLSFSLGGRFTHDQRQSTVVRNTYLGVFSPYFGNPDAASLTSVVLDEEGNEVVPRFSGKRTDVAFTPRISLSWRPAENIHAYVSYSEGFKGGSFDPRGDYSKPEIRDGFKPESVDSYEVGIKNALLDNRISSRFAVFYSDYSNVQIPGSEAIDTDADGINDSFTGTVTNAGKAIISGTELEVSAKLTDKLSIKSALGYIDADYREFIAFGDNLADEYVFQNTPRKTAFAAIDYTTNFAVGQIPGRLSITTEVAYRSYTHQFEKPNVLLDQSGYSLINAGVVWSTLDEHWQFGLYGKNLADKHYKVAGYSFAGFGDGGQTQSAFYGNPRTVTATISFTF